MFEEAIPIISKFSRKFTGTRIYVKSLLKTPTYRVHELIGELNKLEVVLRRAEFRDLEENTVYVC